MHPPMWEGRGGGGHLWRASLSESGREGGEAADGGGGGMGGERAGMGHELNHLEPRTLGHVARFFE